MAVFLVQALAGATGLMKGGLDREVLVSKQWQQGFTLIEMMATISIVAIMIVIAMSTYKNLHEKNRVQSAKEEVVSILQQARLRALSSGESQTVTFDWGADKISYSIRASESKSYDRVDLQGFTCSGSVLKSTGTDTMEFKRNGRVDFNSGPENLRVSSPLSNQIYTIKVNDVTGRIIVVEGGSC